MCYLWPSLGPPLNAYQKGKTNLDFTEAEDSEWQWHQLGHMQVCTSLQTDNQASTPPLSFLQAGCPSCRPTNSVKALKAHKRTPDRCKYSYAIRYVVPVLWMTSYLHHVDHSYGGMSIPLQRVTSLHRRAQSSGPAVSYWLCRVL